MKRFLFADRQTEPIAVHCVPIVEELESRWVPAVTGASSLLPAAQGPTLGPGLQAAPLANNLTPTQPSTLGPAATPANTGALPTATTTPGTPPTSGTGTANGAAQPGIGTPGTATGNPTGLSAAPPFSPPNSFFGAAAGPATGFQIGLPHTATSGALPLPGGSPSSAASINVLTPQQTLAQRAVIFTLPSAPPPAYAYGEGMIIYVAPLDLSTPPMNNPVTTNDNGPVANLDTQPGQDSATAQETPADWQDAVDAYFADVGVR